MGEARHIVGVVGNDIIYDTRIRKVAAAAAAAGFKSTILCYTATDTRSTTEMSGVEVIRVPVPFNAHVKNGRVPNPLRPFDGKELAGRHIGPRTYQHMKRRRLEAKLADDPRNGVVRARLFGVRLAIRIRHDAFRARRKANVTWDKLVRKFHRMRRRTSLRLLRPFRDGVPNIADYEVTFGPILEDLQPDLIHAHDYHMIGLAVTTARKLRAAGRKTKVVYDAHELIEGLSYPKPVIKGWLRLESQFIHDVDALIGVSPEQLDEIRTRHQLPLEPTVVMNAPVARTHAANHPDVRGDLGIDGEILLYHGNVFEERGLDTMVEALVYLDSDAHVAVLAPENNPVVQRAFELAETLGVDSRFHVLGYVPTEILVDYISTADIGVVPYLPTGNNDIALPNKLFESIQAGLPVLVSNMRSLSRYVRERSIGEVFVAGSSEDLAAKATLILKDPNKYRASITDEVRREACWDSQAVKLNTVYGQMLDVEVPPRIHIGVDQITETAPSVGDAHRPTKLAIGPRNMAGQAYQMADAVQHHLGIPAVSFSVEKATYGFPIHRQINEEEWRDPRWQALQRELLGREFTHVIAESGTGILGAMNGGFIDEQLDVLREDGLEVAVLLHGSEIRDPRRHRLLPYSPYNEDNEDIKAMVRATARLRRHLDRIEVPLFVTTPDLLADVDATWLPVVVDTRAWGRLDEAFQNPVPTVLHLPSNNRLKGTPHVEPTLVDLEEAGLIRYLRPSKRVPSSEVRHLVEQSDIVVDQIVIGAYGLMSCQAMAAGRIAIANIRDLGTLRDVCPIVDADPSNLESVIRGLLSERDAWKEIAETGRDYARTYHDGSYTADQLLPFFGMERP